MCNGKDDCGDNSDEILGCKGNQNVSLIFLGLFDFYLKRRSILSLIFYLNYKLTAPLDIIDVQMEDVYQRHKFVMELMIA